MDDEVNIDISAKIYRATFDPEGFPTGFYPDDIWPEGYPAEAIEISEAQWLEFISNAGLRKWQNGEVVEYVPPPPEPVLPDRVSRRQFFMMLDKMDDTTNPGIFDQANGWVASQPRAIRLVYENADSFVRTDEMLQQGFVALGFTPKQINAFFIVAAAL